MPAIIIGRREPYLKGLMRAGLSLALKPLWGLIPKTLYVGKQALNIALTRMCNINCVFCAYQHARRELKIHMPDQVFERVLNDLKHIKIRNIMLSPNIGEPLLAPDFLYKVKKLRATGASHIEVTTNGTCLHKIGIEAILKEGPDTINISFIGFEKEMFERDARARVYEQTRQNILDLLRMNLAVGGVRTVNLGLRGDLGIERMLEMQEMEEVRKLASQVGIMTEVDDWLGVIREEALPEGYRIQTIKPALTKRPCTMLFDLTIHPNGDMEVCSCRNIFNDPDLYVGNLQTMTISEAYARIPTILERWETGLIPDSCRKCSMYCDPVISLAGIVKQEVVSFFRTVG
jgi:MoaA/NifB/PqqE/SkfB family radical SAM enzyme